MEPPDVSSPQPVLVPMSASLQALPELPEAWPVAG